MAASRRVRCRWRISWVWTQGWLFGLCGGDDGPGDRRFLDLFLKILVFGERLALGLGAQPRADEAQHIDKRDDGGGLVEAAQRRRRAAERQRRDGREHARRVVTESAPRRAQPRRVQLGEVDGVPAEGPERAE